MCVVFLRVQTVVWLPVFGIFNVHTDVDVCDCTQALYGHRKSLHWKLTLGKKYLAAPGTQTPISAAPGLSAGHSVPEVYSGRKIPCCTWDSNPLWYCTWLFSRTLYQLNHLHPFIIYVILYLYYRFLCSITCLCCCKYVCSGLPLLVLKLTSLTLVKLNHPVRGDYSFLTWLDLTWPYFHYCLPPPPCLSPAGWVCKPPAPARCLDPSNEGAAPMAFQKRAWPPSFLNNTYNFSLSSEFSEQHIQLQPVKWVFWTTHTTSACQVSFLNNTYNFSLSSEFSEQHIQLQPVKWVLTVLNNTYNFSLSSEFSEQHIQLQPVKWVLTVLNNTYNFSLSSEFSEQHIQLQPVKWVFWTTHTTSACQVSFLNNTYNFSLSSEFWLF